MRVTLPSGEQLALALPPGSARLIQVQTQDKFLQIESPVHCSFTGLIEQADKVSTNDTYWTNSWLRHRNSTAVLRVQKGGATLNIPLRQRSHRGEEEAVPLAVEHWQGVNLDCHFLPGQQWPLSCHGWFAHAVLKGAGTSCR